MTKMKKMNKSQRYIILTVGIIGLFIISFLFYTFTISLNNSKSKTSYLAKNKLVTKTYNIEEDLSELKNKDGDYFIYVSYTGNKEIYNLEKDLKKIIKTYKLKDKFYYINMDSLVNDNNKINAVNELLGLSDVKITKLPTIIYIKNKEIKKGNIITRLDDNLFEKGDFQQLLDINGF